MSCLARMNQQPAYIRYLSAKPHTVLLTLFIAFIDGQTGAEPFAILAQLVALIWVSFLIASTASRSPKRDFGVKSSATRRTRTNINR